MPARARDRDVLLAAAGVVALVLGVRLLATVYPPVDDLLGSVPTVAVVLVAVTALVLLGAVRSRGR